MKKILRRILFCLLLAALVWMGTLISDRQRLNEELIRIRVCAASDSPEDELLKLRVRDAVVENLNLAMENVKDAEAAGAYIRSALPRIEELANRVLREAGSEDTAVVTYLEESFPGWNYGGFSLPSGVYNALNISIGDGEGENWRCVIFPAFCSDSTAESFDQMAAKAGFPETLRTALAGAGGWIRYFGLEVLGRLEKFCSGG